MRFLKKVGGRGTVVLPSDLREALDIHEGDIVEFELIGVVRRGQAAAGEPNDSPRDSATSA